MIAVPIAYGWIMFALTMLAWKHSMDVWSEAWALFALVVMVPATAVGTTLLAAWTA